MLGHPRSSSAERRAFGEAGRARVSRGGWRTFSDFKDHMPTEGVDAGRMDCRRYAAELSDCGLSNRQFVIDLRPLHREHLPADFLEDINRFKYRGSSGKVNMALDALPNFKAIPGPGAHLRGAISISPSVEYMERAYDDAKYGNFSRKPYIDMVIPSLTDPSVAPPGKHVLSCFVQYAPYKLRPGLNWDDQKEAFGDTVVNTIAEYAPNIKEIILHRQVVTPLDLEREWGLSEGNIFQGELSLEQLFFLRPAPGYARFRTPIQNLYMCGSATHPGGGIMGAPGRLAALEMLKDSKGAA